MNLINDGTERYKDVAWSLYGNEIRETFCWATCEFGKQRVPLTLEDKVQLLDQIIRYYLLPESYKENNPFGIIYPGNLESRRLPNSWRTNVPARPLRPDEGISLDGLVEYLRTEHGLN